MLNTGALTTHIMAALDALDAISVGDGIAPQEGGWDQGQPNVGEFKPYVVVAQLTATPRLNQGLTVNESMWDIRYQLRYHGATRSQTDWEANECRQAVHSLVRTTFSTGRVDNLMWQALGGPIRNDSVDPPIWRVEDNFILTCTEA